MSQNESRDSIDGLPVTVINAKIRISVVRAIREYAEYSFLILALVKRDLTVKHKQTLLGVAWTVIKPLFTGLMLAFVFTRIKAKLPVGDDVMSLLLFFYAGLMPWMAFATAVNTATSSLISNTHLISKIYFPRIIVPTAYVLSSVVDYFITFTIFIVMVAILEGLVVLEVLAAMPMFLFMQILVASGLGLFLSVVVVRYRDIRDVVPFVLQIGMYVTVLMPIDAWPEVVKDIILLNPISAIVESYRSIIGGSGIDLFILTRALVVSVFVFLAGLFIFQYKESKSIDII